MRTSLAEHLVKLPLFEARIGPEVWGLALGRLGVWVFVFGCFGSISDRNIGAYQGTESARSSVKLPRGLERRIGCLVPGLPGTLEVWAETG